MIDIEELRLRNQQAMRRSHLVVDVLAPAGKRLDQLRKSIQVVQAEINSAWTEGQENNWDANQ